MLLAWHNCMHYSLIRWAYFLERKSGNNNVYIFFIMHISLHQTSGWRASYKYIYTNTLHNCHFTYVLGVIIMFPDLPFWDPILRTTLIDPRSAGLVIYMFRWSLMVHGLHTWRVIMPSHAIHYRWAIFWKNCNQVSKTSRCHHSKWNPKASSFNFATM